MSSKFSEKLLLHRLLAKNDPNAYSELYDKYVKQIYRFVYFKVSSHEEAEDITSEVFLKAWNFLQGKKEIKSFSGLLYRIARNCVIDLYRQKSAKPEMLIGQDNSAIFETSDEGSWLRELSGKVEVEQIVEALKKLKQEYQEVITLRYIDELEMYEIAEIMDKGTVAVRVTLHRAIKKLKDMLPEQ